jgi:hypothetical protein
MYVPLPDSFDLQPQTQRGIQAPCHLAKTLKVKRERVLDRRSWPPLRTGFSAKKTSLQRMDSLSRITRIEVKNQGCETRRRH